MESQEEIAQSYDNSAWIAFETAAGLDQPRPLNHIQPQSRVVSQDPDRRDEKKRSYDERLPASLMPAESVNVFDHEISAFPDDPHDEAGKEKEMQERNGRGLLAQARQRRVGNPPTAMDQIQEETDDEPENTRVGRGQRTNPA
jgi:hypothetical protein